MIIKSYEIIKKASSFLNYNLFLLYGENNGIKKDIEESIKVAVNQKDKNVEILSLHENEIIENDEIFYNSIYSGSLFSSKKIIIIHECSDKIVEKIKDVVEKYPENTFLIIFCDILEKKSKLRSFFEKNTKTLCIPCYLDNEKDLEIIATQELKKNNIILSRESINLLIYKSNNDRSNLRNEIEKIKSLALNKKNLSPQEIKAVINFTGEHKSDELVNECLCGNITQYKKILSELYANTINQIFILRILANKIQRLLNMKKIEKNYSNLDSLISSLKPPIFWKEKPLVKKQLTLWSLKDLKAIIDEMNDTELLCKKNPQISNAIFFNFFTKICKKTSSCS